MEYFDLSEETQTRKYAFKVRFAQETICAPAAIDAIGQSQTQLGAAQSRRNLLGCL